MSFGMLGKDELQDLRNNTNWHVLSYHETIKTEQQMNREGNSFSSVACVKDQAGYKWSFTGVDSKTPTE